MSSFNPIDVDASSAHGNLKDDNEGEVDDDNEGDEAIDVDAIEADAEKKVYTMQIVGTPVPLKRHLCTCKPKLPSGSAVKKEKGGWFPKWFPVAVPQNVKEKKEFQNHMINMYFEEDEGYPEDGSGIYKDVARPIFPQGVGVKLTIYFMFPCKEEEVDRFPTARVIKPDIDNCVKFVMDALTGLAYHDDSQVCVLKAWKMKDNFPPHQGRTCIELTRVDEAYGGDFSLPEEANWIHEDERFLWQEGEPGFLPLFN